MLFRIQSDLHLEFGQFHPPVMENESDQILLLAGDIGIASKAYTFYPFMEEMSDRFRYVLMIMGNHEHYHGSVVRSFRKIEDELLQLDNAFVLDNEVFDVDGVSIIGSTLWANFCNLDALVMETARWKMNDFRYVRTGSPSEPYKRKFQPSDAAMMFSDAKRFIFDTIAEKKALGNKVVVMTHNGPSFKSIPEAYRGDSLNGAYVSELFENIADTKPNLWIHGHLHDNFDYMIEDTRVVCNPRGYHPSDLNPDFEPCLVIDV